MRKEKLDQIPKALRDRAADEQAKGRFVCRFCGKTVTPSVFWYYPVTGEGPPESYSIHAGGYDQTWCTLRCARSYANAAVRAQKRKVTP